MGVYKSDTWKKAAIYDPATGDVALMTTLIGGDTFLAPTEPITQEMVNGSYQSGSIYRVQFACSDWDAFDTLQGFVDAKTPVQAVAAAESLNCANLQWYVSAPIKSLRKVPKPRRADGDSHFIVELEYEGDVNVPIFNNVNLLHQENVNGVVVTGFVDSDANGLADGYATSGAIIDKSFTAGIQSLTSNAQYQCVFRRVIFPIPGTKYVLSSSLQTVHSQGSTLGLLSLNISNTVITSKFFGVSVGDRATNLTPVDTSHYKIEARPIDSGASVNSSGSGSFKNPCLRTDGSSEYIAG